MYFDSLVWYLSVECPPLGQMRLPREVTRADRSRRVVPIAAETELDRR